MWCRTECPARSPYRWATEECLSALPEAEKASGEPENGYDEYRAHDPFAATDRDVGPYGTTGGEAEGED